MASAKTNMATTNSLALNSVTPLRRTTANRLFALVYASALLALFYHHLRNLLLLGSASSTAATLSLLVADATLAFMWCNTQTFHMYPISRKEHVENIPRVIREADFPALDVFVCTADPYKEPPIGVVNTVMSVMAYEYPTQKLAVYVSDDGGSQLTLFAFMEAARFVAHWLPFCRDNNVVERSPEAYFASNESTGAGADAGADRIKVMYEAMKARVENVLAKGKVGDDLIAGDKQRQALSQWTEAFTRQNHPPVIQVLVDNSKDRDIAGNLMPNLVYVSRGKSKTSPHHFKAGALNALVRVSAVMTNAPLILTLDCDMCSNDPGTVRRALCYLADPNTDRSDLAYVQFPQMFQGQNKDDIYCGSFKRLFQINPSGMKNGPNYVGTGCFFHRRSLFGAPTAPVVPEIPELSNDHVVNRAIQTQETMDLAHRVGSSEYENMTGWGSKVGFRYGSLVEDYFTGYRLHCEGWKSVFCHPDRPAFLGDSPTSLIDLLNQSKRWVIGLNEVAFSKYSPLMFGVRSMGILMSLSYSYYAFWAMWYIPIVIYSFVPQLALINGLPVFPKVSEPWFFLYIFLFVGAYGQEMFEFLMSGHGVTFKRWWNDQRIWLIRGLTSFLFGSVEFALTHLGISTHRFDITSKGTNADQSKMYEQGVFDFGASSPMFAVLSVAALINLIALARGLALAGGSGVESFALQVALAGFGVVNGLPLYEAMFLRNDKGKLPTKVTLVSAFVASLLCIAASIV